MVKKSLLLTLLLALLVPWAAMAQNQLNEGFEGTTFPPEDWTTIHVSGSQAWTRDTGTGNNSSSAYAYRKDVNGGYEDYLITPKLVPATGEELSFYLASEYSYNYAGTTLTIEVSTTTPEIASFTDVIATYNSGGSGNFGTSGSSDWVNKTVDVSAYVGQQIYIAFHAKDTGYNADVRIDDVTGVSVYVPTCPKPTDLSVALTPGDGTVATFAWTETGEATQWQLCINDDESNLIDMDQNPFTYNQFTPETAYTAKVRAYCDDIDQSTWSNTVSFTPTSAYNLTVNDGTITNGVVPIYGYYVDSYTRSQFIIPAEDLTSMQWGSINQMTFYAAADRNWGVQFKVYLTETCETTLSELYNWENMQQVYVGTPAIVGKEMEIVFNTPYQYTGGNLLIGFYQTTIGGYSGCSWYGVTANGASLGGHNTTINQQNFLPKTTFEFVPGEEPACVPASCLAASNISFTNVTLNWFQNSSADAWNVAYSTDGESFTTVDAETNVDYLLDNLTPNTEYTVKVSPANCEAWSNTVTFTTLDPCLTPTNLTVTEIGGRAVVLNWTENGLSEAWVVEITEVVGGQITTRDADTTSFTVSGLVPETEYSVRVRPACNEDLWSTAITFTTNVACPAPTNLAVTDGSITAYEATVTWEGTSNNYVVMMGEEVIGLGTATFEDQTIPSIWENDALYPWVITSGAAAGGTYSMKSGNYHVHNSTSSIQITATYAENTTLEFDARCSSEQNGLNYDWDYGTFYIDGVQQGDRIINSTTFTHYSYEVEAGTHTFMWKYKKDGSANGYDDCLYVDNITNVPMPMVNAWTEYTTDAQTYTLENLTPDTPYQVKVKGDCGDDGESQLSNVVRFTTKALVTYTLNIAGFGDGSLNWYLISSPIGSVNPTNVENMLSYYEDGYDLYAFDQAQRQEEWQNYKSSNFILEPGKGYLYANEDNVTLSFTGEPYTGDGVVTLVKDDAAHPDMLGWNLVGNPFGDTAYIDRPFYVMNEGRWKIIPATTEAIQPMQGIFVNAEEDGEPLTFSTIQPAKSANLALNLSQNNNVVDRAIVNFDGERSLPKFQLSENSTEVYIPMDGKDYAVVSAGEMGELPVSFKAETNGTYTLSFAAEEVSFNYLHLIDNMTGADVDLLAPELVEGPASYTFEASTTDYATRFKLVFATGDNSSDDNFAFYSNGNFVINNEGEATLQVVDVTGRIIKSETINGSASVSVNAATGVYMLRLINGNDVKVQKVVVR